VRESKTDSDHGGNAKDAVRRASERRIFRSGRSGI
jgi:hypothetical protein